VLTQLNASRSLFQSYLRIRSSVSSSTSPELTAARNDLQDVLHNLQADIEELVEAVNAVELDPYSFGLQIDEVRRRRKLVDEVGDEVNKMHNDLKSVQETQLKSPGFLPDPSKFDDEDDYAQEFEQQRQQEIMHEQDEVIDEVFQTVRTLRQQGDAFGQELEEQGELLNDMDNMADRVGGKLQYGLRKMGQVIEQNEDKWSSCCIGLLIAVLIILLLLLLIL
jgi:t-SNARE syntaxin family protein